MNKKDIEKAFAGRWRIYGLDEAIEDNAKVKEYARKFFEAGVLIGQESVTEGFVKSEETTTGIEVAVMNDSIINTVDNGFSEWWEMYGKKIDRTKCLNKWKKLTDEERRACIASTPAYVASTPDLQFRRHPATYLNNKSWENQIIHRNGTDKSTADREKLADILAP